MFEIFEYLKDNRNNNQNYFDGVNILVKYCPNHVLLAKLKSQVSALNRIYLKQALKKTYEELKNKPALVTPKSTVSVSEPTDPNAWQSRINKELAKLYKRRRDLSNSFHDCTSKEERAHVSDQIKSIIDTISSHKARLRTYRDTGKLTPPPRPKKGFKIPDKDLELIRLRNSLRSRISIKKKTIETWKGDEPKKKTKAQHEFDLSRLKKELNLVYTEIEKRGIK